MRRPSQQRVSTPGGSAVTSVLAVTAVTRPPRRPDPEQDLLSVKHPPRLRQEVDALGAATRYAIQEWPGQPVPK